MVCYTHKTLLYDAINGRYTTPIPPWRAIRRSIYYMID